MSYLTLTGFRQTTAVCEIRVAR